MKVNQSRMHIRSSSSASSSKDSGGGGGSGGRKSSSDSSSDSKSGSNSFQNDEAYRKEKKLMRIKAYDTFKIPALPKSAAEARGFRNQLKSSITKIQKGDEAPALTIHQS